MVSRDSGVQEEEKTYGWVRGGEGCGRWTSWWSSGI